MSRTGRRRLKTALGRDHTLKGRDTRHWREQWLESSMVDPVRHRSRDHDGHGAVMLPGLGPLVEDCAPIHAKNKNPGRRPGNL